MLSQSQDQNTSVPDGCEGQIAFVRLIALHRVTQIFLRFWHNMTVFLGTNKLPCLEGTRISNYKLFHNKVASICCSRSSVQLSEGTCEMSTLSLCIYTVQASWNKQTFGPSIHVNQYKSHHQTGDTTHSHKMQSNNNNNKELFKSSEKRRQENVICQDSGRKLVVVELSPDCWVAMSVWAMAGGSGVL